MHTVCKKFGQSYRANSQILKKLIGAIFVCEKFLKPDKNDLLCTAKMNY